MRPSSLLAITSVLATTYAGMLPTTCQLDEFYAELWFPERTTFGGCTWWVCGQDNAWRRARECGMQNSCKMGQPTTCVDQSGMEH